MRKEIIIAIFILVFVFGTIFAYLSPNAINQKRHFVASGQKLEMNGNYNQFDNQNADFNLQNAKFNSKGIKSYNGKFSNNIAINNSDTSFENINSTATKYDNQNVDMNKSFMQHVDINFSDGKTSAFNTSAQNANMYNSNMQNTNAMNNNTSTNNFNTANNQIGNSVTPYNNVSNGTNTNLNHNQVNSNNYNNNSNNYNNYNKSNNYNNNNNTDNAPSEYSNNKNSYYETVNWNIWKSNFLNKILDDCDSIPTLNNYKPGTLIWFSFDVSDTGAISNVTVFSQALSQEDKLRMENVIKRNAYKPITVFPKNSRRKSVNVRTIMKLDNGERRARPEDFHDRERVLVE